MTIEQVVEVAAPVERVFALLADLSRAPEWQSSVESVHVDDGGETGVGTRGREVRRFAGRRSEASFEVVAFEPNERLAISSRASAANGTATFTLEPRDGATRVSLDLELQLGGPLRFLGGAARGRIERETRADLDRLKQLAEAG